MQSLQKSLGLMIVTFALLGCGQKGEAPVAQSTRPCVESSVYSDGVVDAACDVGIEINGQFVGTASWAYSIDPARGCDQYRGSGQLGPDVITVRVDEATGKITYSSSEGDLSMVHGPGRDEIVVSSARPGEALNQRVVPCTGLDDFVLSLQTQESCGEDVRMDDPDIVDHFRCSSLESELESDPVLQALIKGRHVEIGMALTTVTELDQIVQKHGSAKRGEVIAVVALLGTIVKAVAEAATGIYEAYDAYENRHKYESDGG